MTLIYERFSDVNLSDVFFDSLKDDYKEFPDWFNRKAAQGDGAYVFYNQLGLVDGFLYLKREDEAVLDVYPNLPPYPRLKVGTLKINAHGTRLGERFIKKIFDHAVEHNLKEIYVTAFEKHEGLIALLRRYGFDVYGNKSTPNGIELVFVKRIGAFHSDSLLNYPMLDMKSNRCFLLAIYPEFHTRMLPDSILKNESFDVIQDVSHTNSIHKIYLAAMQGVASFTRGDVLLIYRTNDYKGPAHYRSVVTSACVVEEVRNIHEFSNFTDFRRYCESYSVFDLRELENFYATKRYPFIIKFSYNVAMKKRITRGNLIDEYGMRPKDRWSIVPLVPWVAKSILINGGVDESLIID
ncbi:hypothetical protein QT231_23285 [Halomonas sp. SpR1]|uniref:hypothetical protein n=1 Tax=Halomonas sp. SpR1 TaxID=3050462 RepID=UPI0027E44DD6|nr:hypothetical protein [Halomonas sp. SpR1]MDQ7735632.1 hypothetical protein [Halomonas sp. SpR1]